MNRTKIESDIHREDSRVVYTNDIDTVDVAVVIPIYKDLDQLNAYEIASLERCFCILNKYTKVFVAPECLNTKPYVDKFDHNDTLVELFDNAYFENLAGYNALMLSLTFYSRFERFQYILIYQLDAWVFEDQLIEWCKLGYDYIGAPWLTDRYDGNWINTLYRRWKSRRGYSRNLKDKKSNLPIKEQFYNKVGNGGFSLRKVDRMIAVLKEMPDFVMNYIDRSKDYAYNEDVFWSLEANREQNRLKIPHYKIAVLFSIEFMPEKAFRLTKGVLPFGCHDWDNYLSFWGSKIL